MATIGVLGASGHLGRLVAAEVVRRGHDLVAAGPDPERLRARTGDLDVAEVARAETDDPASLEALARRVDVLIGAAGPHQEVGRPVVDVALRARVPYLDASIEPGFVSWVYGREREAVDAGVALVPGAGFPTLPLDPLAHLAAGAVTAPEALHLAMTVPSRGGLRAAAGRGTRRAMAGVLVDGRRLSAGMMVAEHRRLAWFPRPVGPAHAASVPAVASVTVPRHVADVAMVRTYLAVPGWRAEALQLTGNAVRWAPARRRVERLLGGGPVPSRARARAVQWAAVAETRGTQGVVRAWANGTDPGALSAVAQVLLAEHVLAGGVGPGVHPPAAVAEPGALLDAVSVRGDLRWSMVRPSPDR